MLLVNAADYTATVVERLQTAGAVVLGKVSLMLCLHKVQLISQL